MLDPNQHTPNVGRVRSTRNIADFETSFKILAYKWKDILPGDWIDLLSYKPENANIPNNSAHGLLGVVDAKNAINNFVGVEFDNYVNPWDPNFAQVGINVNSLCFIKIMPWTFSEARTIVDAKITYN